MLNSLPTGGNLVVVGASRGIGLEFVRQLLQEPRHSRIFATSRDVTSAPALAALAAGDARLRVVPLDVRDEESIAAAAEVVGASAPELHLVVNCAGVLHDSSRGMVPEKRLAEVSARHLATSFAVNAFGPLLVARHFERLLARRDRAIFASLSARVGSIGDNRLGGWYAYRASKAAQNMFTRTLAIEWGRTRRNVICVALHPGTTDTDLSRPFQANVPAEKLFSAERAVRQLLAVLAGLTPADSGRFLGWDGSEIPW